MHAHRKRHREGKRRQRRKTTKRRASALSITQSEAKKNVAGANKDLPQPQERKGYR
jgi:hypothetical protein